MLQVFHRPEPEASFNADAFMGDLDRCPEINSVGLDVVEPQSVSVACEIYGVDAVVHELEAYQRVTSGVVGAGCVVDGCLQGGDLFGEECDGCLCLLQLGSESIQFLRHGGGRTSWMVVVHLAVG